MKRHRLPNGRDKHGSGYVKLERWMMETQAWKACNPVERALYLHLATFYRGSNNGSIHLSVREAAAELGVGKSTISRAFEALEQRGFIEPVQKGSFGWKLRHATTWLLTEYPNDLETGSVAKKTFARWTAEIQNPVPVVGLTVPVVEPIGIRGGTVVAQRSPHGTRGGTVRESRRLPSVPVAGHS